MRTGSLLNLKERLDAIDNAIGIDTGYDSTATTANADGSIMERLEDLKDKVVALSP